MMLLRSLLYLSAGSPGRCAVHNTWLVVLLTLGSALAFALASSLKHVSATHLPDAQSMHPGKLGRFIWATLTHRLWLGGIGCDAVGLALQILALHLGALVVVQPLLISGLLFTLLLRQRFEHHHITARQLGWAALLTVSLAGFLLLATDHQLPAHEAADRLPAIVAGALGAVLAGGCVVLGRRQRGGGRGAALLGVAVGIIYAGTAALLKSTTDIAIGGPLPLLASWQLYTVVLLGAAGLLLAQLAFQAGPITASLPATATVDPLLSIVVGVLVYDEQIRRGPGDGALLVVLLVVLTLAVVQLTREPARSGTAAPNVSA
jgi:drug/metabolite transporter (DMT)-like permease